MHGGGRVRGEGEAGQRREQAWPEEDAQASGMDAGMTRGTWERQGRRDRKHRAGCVP